MASIYNTNPNELIEKVAEQLKSFEEIKAPSWASFVKTGHSKERPPVEKDWWYIRFAAVLRSIYKLGPVGVSKLRTKYGSKKNRGVRPSHFYKGSGNILRKILQQGEKAGLLKQVEKGVHKGRILTPKGKSLLDKTAASILKNKPKTSTVPKPKLVEKEKTETQPKEAVKPKPAKEEESKKDSSALPEKGSKEEMVKEAEPKKEQKSKRETPKEAVKEEIKKDSDSKKIAEVEKEVKEIKEKELKKEKKEPQEKTKKDKDKEEIKKVEELVKDIQTKAIKKSKK